MGATLSERLTRMGYAAARRLLLGAGLAVLAVVVLVTYARRVDTVEVLATLLFVPIFLAFALRGVLGGLVGAIAAIAAYGALRYPAIEAVGVGEFSGLLLSRSAAYLIFGAVGGWSMQVLEGSLVKLDLVDEVDDETGLYNARHLLRQTDLEVARARRYETLFSVVVLELPADALMPLRPRDRRRVLRDLGRLLGEGVRNVDHVVHLRVPGRHRLVAVLPETAHEGAEVFRSRFGERIRGYLEDRGVALSAEAVTTRALTFPGDDDAIASLRAEVAELDAIQHR